MLPLCSRSSNSGSATRLNRFAYLKATNNAHTMHPTPPITDAQTAAIMEPEDEFELFEVAKFSSNIPELPEGGSCVNCVVNGESPPILVTGADDSVGKYVED